MQDELPDQSLIQKQIAFAGNPDAIAAAVEILKSTFTADALVGGSEYETVVNAVKFDTQQNVMLGFFKQLDFIRTGGLINKQR
jgi:hypothetical protein